MGNFEHNRFDGNFALRVTIASLICPFPLVLLVLIGPLFTGLLGGLTGLVLTLSLCSVVIAVIADLLKLVPFPLITSLKDDIAASELDTARRSLWHTFSALPLSFASALIWTATGALSVESYAAPFMLIIISPMTIAFLILHLETETPSQALHQSLKSFILMLLVVFALFPGPLDREAPKGVQDNMVENFPR